MKTLIAKMKAWMAARKPKLIDEWRHGWKFLSVQLAALAAAFQELPQYLPPWAHDALPGEWWGYIAKFLFVTALVSRFVKQNNVPTQQESGHE